MRTIRIVFRRRSFTPLEPTDLPGNTPARVALLENDDLSADALAKLATTGKAFDFLNDPREDIYSESDGESL